MECGYSRRVKRGGAKAKCRLSVIAAGFHYGGGLAMIKLISRCLPGVGLSGGRRLSAPFDLPYQGS